MGSSSSDRTPRARPAATAKTPSAAKKRKAPVEPSEPSTPEADALREIESAIDKRRQALAAERARLPEMRAVAASKRAEAQSLGAQRATMRRARNLMREAECMDVSIARIESGVESAAFDARAERYLTLARANAAAEADGALGRPCKRTRTDPVLDAPDGGTAPTVPSSVTATTATTNVALLREYMAEFEEQAPPMHIVQHDACPTCAVPLLLSVNGALLTCPECRAGYPYMDATTASMAYGDEVEFMSNNPKKAHHFEDRLKMFQGKGSKRVTKEVLDAVMEWHVTQGITSVDDITTLTVRQALKANASRDSTFRDFYDFDMYIWCSITGKPAPVLGPTKENYCRQMFMRIQAPYAKWRARINPTRINFLSYVYVLYKFFQLLNWVEYLPYFSLLKGRDKLQKQEAIWEGICRDVKWPFIPVPSGPPAPPRASTSRASTIVAAPPSSPSPSSAETPTPSLTTKAPAVGAQPKAHVAPRATQHVRTSSALLIAMGAARVSRALPS